MGLEENSQSPTGHVPAEVARGTISTAPTRHAAAGIAAGTLGTICWGFTGIFVKLISLPPLPVALYRLWLGAAMMAIALLAGRRALTWRALARSVPGGLFLGADIALFFSSLKFTSVAVATVIGALQPALVLVVAGPWFGERPGRKGVAWTFISMAGVAAVALGGGMPSGRGVLGDCLAVASLLAFTGYWLASKRARAGNIGAGQYTAGVMLVAALALTPVTFASGQALGPITGRDWAWLVLLALVPGAGHLLFNWAHRFVDVSVSSVIGAGNPVVAGLAALVILGQPLSLLQMVGGAVAVVAIAVVAKQAARRQAGPAAGTPIGPQAAGRRARHRPAHQPSRPPSACPHAAQAGG
jgi:drug/metabolite transporter (DMT)-like permease